mmetsp:Transcript_9635/g.29705  ORF Transcript_9635/g.29705 Transcript_9635/m.29705 type:complete len:485 (-) Transcript_9635:39-1493(-)
MKNTTRRTQKKPIYDSKNHHPSVLLWCVFVVVVLVSLPLEGHSATLPLLSSEDLDAESNNVNTCSVLYAVVKQSDDGIVDKILETIADRFEGSTVTFGKMYAKRTNYEVLRNYKLNNFPALVAFAYKYKRANVYTGVWSADAILQWINLVCSTNKRPHIVGMGSLDMTAVRTERGTFLVNDSHQLDSRASISFHHWHVAQKSKPQTSLVLLHDVGLHSGLFQWIVAELATRFHVWGVDFPGHGQSYGERGHVDQFSDLTDVTLRFIQMIEKQMRFELEDARDPQRLVLIGHGLGCLVALDAVRVLSSQQGVSPSVSGVACLGTDSCWERDPSNPSLGMIPGFLRELLNQYWPSFTVMNPLNHSIATGWERALLHRIADPLTHPMSSVRLQTVLSTERLQVQNRTLDGNLNVPVWMAHGQEDLAPKPADCSTKWISLLPKHLQAKCRVLSYPNSASAIHEDRDLKRVAKDLLAWIDMVDPLSDRE